MSIVDQALEMAARGVRVFPLAKDCNPLENVRWHPLRTRNPEKIRAQIKSATAYGAATGDGIVVVDVDHKDGKKPGLDTFEYLDMVHGFPRTLTARSRTGGKHLWYRVPIGMQLKNDNRGRVLGEGVDFKAHGGFVVGPGSVAPDGRGYTIEDNAPIADLPNWILEKCEEEREHAPRDITPACDWNLPENVERARQYLRYEAPPAVENDHGDDTLIEVAFAVRDWAIDEAQIAELLLDEYNERCEPPWDPEDIYAKAAGAMRYGKNRPGCRQSAFLEFDDVSALIKSKPLQPGKVSIAQLRSLPPREWLYGHKLSRKYVSFCASPGGVGKTAWAIALALSCASGRALLHDRPHKPLRVWMLNLEDDIVEMRRRVAAALKHYDLPASVLDNLYLNSGRDRALKVVGMRDGAMIVQPDAKEFTKRMIEKAIDVSIIDPYLRSHSVPENANEAQDEVMRVFAQVADEANASITLLHHTKKGATAGDMDSLRGGSTQGGGARSVFTLATMSAEEARAMGVPDLVRRRYIRIDDAKNNMAPPMAQAEWLHLASVNLGNATVDYPAGDSVQVAVKWAPPDAWEDVNEETAALTLKCITDGMLDGERYSRRSQDKNRWAGEVIMEKLGKSKLQAGVILDEWLKRGALEERRYESPKQRKTRSGLFAGTETEETPEITS